MHTHNKMKAVACTTFLVVVMLIYTVNAFRIKKRYTIAADLLKQCESLLSQTHSDGPHRVLHPKDCNILVFDATGSVVFMDSKSGFTSVDGQPANETQMNLYQKINGASNVRFATHVIDEYIETIAIVKTQDKQYCVVAYTVV